MIFLRDFWWEIARWSYRTQGVIAERTETWDIWQVIQGMIIIVAGLVLLFGMLDISAYLAQQEVRSTATASTAQAAVDDLNTRLSPYLIEWRDLATERRAYYVEPRRFDSLRGLQVFYGRCTLSNDFYVYVFGYSRSDERALYAYFDPPRPPSGCLPSGLSISSFTEPLRLTGGWYYLRAFSVYSELFTRTPPPEPTTTPTPNP